MLLILQVLSIVWFGMIIKVAVSMLRGEGANDTRSGDEDEGDDLDEGEFEAMCDEKVRKGIYANGNAKASPSSRNGKVGASGSESPSPRQNVLFQRGTARIRVPGSRDRKELIGRVGCNG